MGGVACPQTRRSSQLWPGSTASPGRSWRAIDHFHPFLARFLKHHVTSQRKDLRQPGPIAVADEGRTRREIALCNAPMA